MAQSDCPDGSNGAAALDLAFEAAVSLHERQDLDGAEAGYRGILAADPTHFGTLHNLGMLCVQRQRLELAAGLLRRAVEQDPASPEAQDHLGSVLQGLGRHEAAIPHYEAAVAIEPDNAEAHYNLGTALQALDHHEAAIASYRRALALDPSIAEISYNLGTANAALDRHEAAIEQYRRALALRPGYARAHAALASGLQALGQHGEAVTHFEAALAGQPDDPEVRNDFGIALQRLGRHHDAVAQYRRSLALRPDYAQAHNNLGLALQALDRHAEALACHERALVLEPRYAAAHNNLGLALQCLDRHDEALERYRRAVAINPGDAAATANMGLALQEIGRIDEAREAFGRAVALAPRSARFHRHLADCTRFTPDDPHLAAMERLARESDSLPEDEQRQLHFALGKAYDDVGDYARSFRHLLAGNRIKRRQIVYDEDAVLAEFDRVRSTFTPELMRREAGSGHPSNVPVFILGMPRSGSTLVEQILASHPGVFGAGERVDLGEEVARLRTADGRVFPETAGALSGAELQGLGARYLGRLRAAAPDAARITDKMPFNFFFAGLIHLALPNARIIHTIRDPLDTCLSCFARLFTGQHRCAYDLAELGRYYRAYERLMDHWRRVLPPGVMLDVRYEDVVAALEPQARRIVAHCGLQWDQSCLAFGANPRPVRTASAVQVRGGIHSDSVGRAQHYGELLAPLLAALGPGR